MLGAHTGTQDLAQNAAMQEAMQLMFGQDGGYMPAALELGAQGGGGTPDTKPAVMQRLSVLARGPADAPALRPFNMLGTPDTLQPPMQSDHPTQCSLLAGFDNSFGSFLPDSFQQAELPNPALASTPAGMDEQRLSMTGMVMDNVSAEASWLTSTAAQSPSPAKKAAQKSRRHSTTAGAKQTDEGHAHQLHVIAEAGIVSQDWDSQQSSLQPEFSFSPLGDSIQQDVAFSPLAAGAGQIEARPSMGQRIRKSLFGPAKDTAPSSEAKLAKVRCNACQ